MVFDTGDPEAAEEMKRAFGLDKPLHIQYLKYIVQVAQGNFGNSIYGSGVPVSRIIAEAFPRTMSITVLGFLLAMLIAIPAGLISALKKHSGLDHAVTVVAFLGLSMPDFWLAILLIIVFAANLHWLPAIGYVPLAEGFWPWFSHLIMPAIAIGTPFAAIIARGMVLTIKQEQYIDSARTIGVSDARIMWRHILPNATAPIIVQATVSISYAILAEAGLSFLGLGVEASTPTWGLILAESRSFISRAWWLGLFPGLAIMMTVLIPPSGMPDSRWGFPSGPISDSMW